MINLYIMLKLILSSHLHCIVCKGNFFLSFTAVHVDLEMTNLEGRTPKPCPLPLLLVSSCFIRQNKSWIFSDQQRQKYNNNSCCLIIHSHIPFVRQVMYNFFYSTCMVYFPSLFLVDHFWFYFPLQPLRGQPTLTAYIKGLTVHCSLGRLPDSNLGWQVYSLVSLPMSHNYSQYE